MRRVLTACLWMTLLCLPRVGAAQTAPTPSASGAPAIKVGGVLFYDYTTTTAPKTKDADGNTITTSVFNVSRGYVNISGNLSPVVAFRLTPDIAREAGTGSSLAGSLTYRIKYAYAQFGLDQWTGRWTNTFVRLGVQQTPFIEHQDGIYRYRFQGTTFFEREGAMSSADTGATFHTDFPDNYGDLHVGLYNGEGYTKPEANDQKALMVRGTIRPMAHGSEAAKGLRLTGFYDHDHYLKSAPRSRLATSLSYEHPRFNLGVDYLAMRDQTSINASLVEGHGWSAFVTPFFQEKGRGLEALIRVDRYTPNLKLGSQERQRTIVGGAYWFPHMNAGTSAALLFDFEQLKFSGFPAIPLNVTQERVALHGLIQF